MKNRIYLLSFLAILFSTILFSHHSFAKETSAKGIPQQLEELTKQLNTLSTTVSEQQQTLNEMQSQHQQELGKLNDVVTSQATKISQLENTISNQQKQINNLEVSAKSQGENIDVLQTQLQSFGEELASGLNELSSSLNNFKEQVESQFNQIFKELNDLKKNPPVDNQNGYTVSGRMIDSNGNPFRSGFTLVDQFGKRYGSKNLESDGSFSLTNIPNGSYHIEYYFRSYEVSQQEFVVDGKNVNNLLIQLTVPTYTITGKALTSDGEPLSFKQVSLVQNGNTGGYWPSTTSDGSFALDGIAPGNYTLLIGDYQNPVASMEIQVNDNMNNLIVQGFHAYKVSGFLADSNGELFYTSFSLVDQNNHYYHAFKNGNGFSAPNVPNGVYKIRFSIEPYQGLIDPNLEIVVNGQNIDNFDVRINAPTFYASGMALDANGNPIGNERIHIYNPSTSGWGADLKTNSDGSFVVAGLPNGTYLLKIGNDRNNPIVQGQATIQDGNLVGIIIQQN